jgi:metal-responsive CopG/Arc/MetJ family transcriptional regulator
MAAEVVRTTLALPADLLAAADRIVRQGGAASRDELVAAALRREVALLEREVIDRAFAEMGNDQAYLNEANQLMDEFSAADLEAWKLRDHLP